MRRTLLLTAVASVLAAASAPHAAAQPCRPFCDLGPPVGAVSGEAQERATLPGAVPWAWAVVVASAWLVGTRHPARCHRDST